MSTRQDIVDAVTTRLKTIQKSGGYNTDLGYNVYEWRQSPFEQTELPAVNVREAVDYELNTLAAQGAVMRLTLTVCASDGDSTMSTLRKAVADVRTAVATDETWGGLAWFTVFVESRSDADQEERLVAAEEITMDVYYETAFSAT